MKKFVLIVSVIVALSACSANKMNGEKTAVSNSEADNLVYPTIPLSKPNPMSLKFFAQGDMAATQGDVHNGIKLLKIASSIDTSSVFIKQRLVEVLLENAQAEKEMIQEALDLAESIYNEGYFNSETLTSLSQAYLFNQQPDEALRIYDVKLKYDPQGEDYFRMFVINAKYLKNVDFKLLDKAYELSNNNPLLIKSIAEVRSVWQPKETIAMLQDSLDKSYHPALMELLIRMLSQNKDEDGLITILEKHISDITEFQKGILIELLYQKEEYEKIVADFDYYYDTNEAQIQRYLFSSCVGKEHLILLDKIYDRLITHEDFTQSDRDIFSLMAAESWWMIRNQESTAKYLSRVGDFAIVHDFFIKRFISDFSQEEKDNIDYLLLSLSQYGVNQGYVDFLFARKYYLAEAKSSAYDYAKKVDPELLRESNLISVLAVIYLQCGDDIKMADKLFDMRSETETLSRNEIYAQYYYQKSEYKKAEADIDKELNDNETPSLYAFKLKITLLDRDKRYDEEIEVLEKTLVFYPEESFILNALAYLLTETGQITDKIPYYLEIALEKEPDNVNFIDSYAWYYYKTGDYNKAKQTMDRAIKLGFDSSVIAYHIGAIFHKLSMQDEAVEYYRKAQMLNNDTEAVVSATKALGSLNQKDVNND